MSNSSFSALISVTGTPNQINETAGLYPVTSIANNAIFPGTGGNTLSTGTTAQRAGSAGTIRFNAQTLVFEGTTDGATWETFSTGAGVVLSVSGTAHRITSTGGVNPVIDIAADYVGQASLTTLGTITTGIWNGTKISEGFGGTNQSTYILGDTLYASAANTLSKLAGNTTAGIQYLAQTGTGAVSAAPAWTTISGGDITGAALTKTDDTNVTMTLGGTPSTALLRATSMTLGWTGQLSLARGGTNANLTASNGGIFYSTATAGAILSGTATATQMLQSGSSTTPAWSTSTWPATTTINQILYSSSANTVAGLATANRAVLTTGATGIPVMTALAVDGQLIIGSTAGVPAAATLTAGTGITITNGSNSISIATTGGAPVTSVSGTANRITSTGGTTPVIDISAAYIGQSSITTLGTITTGVWNGSLIDLAHGGSNANLTASNGGIVWSNASQMQILSGTATAGQMLQSGSTATPAWSTTTYPATNAINTLLYASSANVMSALTATANGTLITGAAGIPSIVALANGTILIGTAGAPAASTATYPATTSINQILYSSSANVIGGLTATANGTLITGAAGIPSIAALTDGQVIVGSSAGAPLAATISAGAGVTVTNGHNTITIAASGSGAFVWNTSTSSPITLAVNNGYVANSGSAITFNVPATVAVGQMFIIEGLGAGLSIIQMNTGQTCHFGSNATTSAGSLTATNQYDAITITCTVANTTFNARGQGNWTIA